MPTELERRFLRFLKSVPGSEALDDLLAGEAYRGERRADYLLFERRVIVEVKSLETDTSPKVEKEMDQHRERDDFPLVYGKVELSKVLDHLPDGKAINDRIFFKTTRSIEDATRSAEEQITNTARILGLPGSVGVLVMLNQGVDILTPEIVASRVAMLMQRKGGDGLYRSPIAFSWLLFESHIVTNGPADRTLPMIALKGPHAAAYAWFDELLTYLEVAWAQFNGRPLFEMSPEQFKSLSMASAAPSKELQPGEKLTKQQLWELTYKHKLYLRALPDDQVLLRGKQAIDALTPYFLSGGPKYAPEQVEPLMVVWNDFLCEARYRGLDLRQMRDA
jgi:hypothetical protein